MCVVSMLWRDCELGLCTAAGDCWTTSTPTSRALATRAPTMPAKTVHNACLIRIDRDHRLAVRQETASLFADVFKLSIPVHMLASFVDLPIGLQAIVQLAQAIANDRIADVVPLSPQLRA